MRRLRTLVYRSVAHKMPAVQNDWHFKKLLGKMKTSSSVSPDAERRGRPRLPLRWPLTLRKGPPGDQVWVTITDNLSSRGFACVVAEPLSTGDDLDCVLQFPSWTDGRPAHTIRCDARVVWVKVLDGGRYAIGCGIYNYNLVA
jgi:hypothetical protein